MAVMPRLGSFHRIGFEATAPLIPPVAEATTWFEADPLRIGVELRTLEEYDKPDAFRGPSIHVCGLANGLEYLRFDVFDGLPHYHYIDLEAGEIPGQAVPGESDVVVAFDHAACGPMWPWTVECLRSRLPAMLHECGIHDLADAVDNSAIAPVVAKVVEIAAPHAPTAHRTPPSAQPDWDGRTSPPQTAAN